MKVKCINDDFSKVHEEILRESNGLPITFPKKDEVYTIRESFDNDGLVTSYLLMEIYNPIFHIPILNIRRELSFAEWRFEHVNDDESVKCEIEEHNLITNKFII